eukprot:101597-Chlamydomonas_euryale.AAC.5
MRACVRALSAAHLHLARLQPPRLGRVLQWQQAEVADRRLFAHHNSQEGRAQVEAGLQHRQPRRHDRRAGLEASQPAVAAAHAHDAFMHAVCERAQRRAYRRRGAGRERAIGRVKHDVRQRAAAAAHAVAKARAARLRQAAIRCRLELLQRRQLASKRRQLQHGQLPRLWCAAALRVFVAWPWVGRLSSVMRVRRAAAPAVARLEHLCNAPFRWRRRRGVCNRQHERLGVGEPHQPKVELRCQQCHARPRRVCTHDDWHRRAMLYLHTQHMLLRPGRARRRQERHLHVQLGQRGNLAVRRPHRHRRRQRTAAAGCTGYAAARLLLEAHGEVRRRARRVVQRHDTRGGATSGEHAGQQQRARRDVQRQRHPDALQPQLQQRHCVALCAGCGMGRGRVWVWGGCAAGGVGACVWRDEAHTAWRQSSQMRRARRPLVAGKDIAGTHLSSCVG